MDVFTLILLSIMMFSSMRAIKMMRNEMLYNKVANKVAIYVSEIVGFVISQGLMIGLIFYLSKQFSVGSVVSACFIHIMINAAVQILTLNKENQEKPDSQYGYLKWIWMAGVALYSGLFMVALQNSENVFVWVIGTGIAYTLYNLSYFFFLYFTEKEILQTRSRSEDVKPKIDLYVKPNPVCNTTSDMAESVKSNMRPDIESDRKINMESDIEPNIDLGIKVDVKPNARPARKLLPIHKMYGEDYRKLKLEEVRVRNKVALLMFCIPLAFLIVHVVLLLWGLGVPMAAQMTLFMMFLFMAGVVYLTCCRMKAERNVKTMQIETVYEGMAQVVAHPLTV